MTSHRGRLLSRAAILVAGTHVGGPPAPWIGTPRSRRLWQSRLWRCYRLLTRVNRCLKNPPQAYPLPTTGMA